MVQYASYATPRLDLGVAFMEYMSDESRFKEWIGLDALPAVNVARQAGTFSILTRDTMLSEAEVKRAAKSAYNRIDTKAKDQSYRCEEYGLEGVVDDKERALYANDFDHEMSVMTTIARKLRLAHEVRVAAAVFNTTTWTGASLYTDRSGTPWSTTTTKIVDHVVAAKEKVRTGSGMEPNAIIIPRPRLEDLLINDQVKKDSFPGKDFIAMDDIKNALRRIFGLEYIFVGNAVKNTADEGATATLADVWDSKYVMICRVARQGDSLSEPCIGRTFLWTQESPEELVVESYRDEKVRGDVLRVRHDVDELIIAKEFGHLLKVTT